MGSAILHSTGHSGHLDPFTAASLPPRDTWPALHFDLPGLQYPPRLNCAAELLDRTVASGGGARLALLGTHERWTYADLLERVDRIAHVLRGQLGLVPGNRVLLRGGNTPLMAAALLAVLKAGLVAVPTMPLLRTGELAAIVAKAQVNAVLCAASLRDDLDAVPGLPPVVYFGGGADEGLEARMARAPSTFDACDTAADDVCLIGFTSGTTGVPKGTLHFHRDLLAICDCFPPHVLRSQPSDVFIGTPPLAFTFGLGGLLLFPLRVGAAAVLLEHLTPATLLAAIAQYRATVCFTAPTAYRQMAPLVAAHDVSCLRETVSAGEVLPVATRAAWQAATGLAMIDGIGSTELLHIFISAAGDHVRPGATGKPIPGYRACILDAHGNPVGPGVVGRLAVQGPTGCRYLDDPRQQQYVHQGWNLTGDAYEMDEDGYFYYRARTDDMIVSSGYNIAGPEVEDALLAHPDVAECCVVGTPDEVRGQLVEAHVVLRAGVKAAPERAAALQAFVKHRIAPYKYPRRIRFVATLPRTASGKLQRFLVRAP